MSDRSSERTAKTNERLILSVHHHARADELDDDYRRVAGDPQRFRGGGSTATLFVVAYLVAMASVLPIAGKIGDIFGRRRLILAGVIYFGIASIGAALAPTLPMLIIFRVQQAIAGAIAFPNGAALVREVVPEIRRAR